MNNNFQKKHIKDDLSKFELDLINGVFDNPSNSDNEQND